MAGSARPLLAFLLFFFLFALTFPRNRATAAPPLCPRSDLAFLDDIESQCPLWIELSSPQEVSGVTFERELSGKQSAYYSILFYASWCPFSSNTRPMFDALSSMFPQIKHLLVEESSVMPSVLSRNGIHSFPAVMLLNGTTRVQYHGSRDLTSLVQFYKKNTGLNPVIHLEIEQLSSERVRSHVLHVESARELISHEPYLTFSIFFICLKIIMCFFPVIYSRFKAFWVSHAWPLNSRVLCESSQLLEQVLHVIDVKRLWSNIRLCNKTRNFQKGANNARAWASSLASVSLSESSSSRLALVDSWASTAVIFCASARRTCLLETQIGLMGWRRDTKALEGCAQRDTDLPCGLIFFVLSVFMLLCRFGEIFCGILRVPCSWSLIINTTPSLVIEYPEHMLWSHSKVSLIFRIIGFILYTCFAFFFFYMKGLGDQVCQDPICVLISVGQPCSLPYSKWALIFQ